MNKISKLNIKDKLKDFKMCYTITELHECLHNLEDNNSGIFSHEKRAWFKNNNKPKMIKNIDEQLKIAFNINKKAESVICIYYPSTKKKNLVIKDQNKNILNRVVISSINELANLSFATSSEQIEFKNWTAYLLPDLISSFLSLEFDNNKITKTLERKGYRSKKMKKDIDNRYIIVIDYILQSNEMEKLSSNLLNTLKK